MTNRIKVGDNGWVPISNLSDFPLSRVHSVEYDPVGHVYQIAFGRTILELDYEQALELKKVCEGIEVSPFPLGDSDIPTSSG